MTNHAPNTEWRLAVLHTDIGDCIRACTHRLAVTLSQKNEICNPHNNCMQVKTVTKTN